MNLGPVVKDREEYSLKSEDPGSFKIEHFTPATAWSPSVSTKKNSGRGRQEQDTKREEMKRTIMILILVPVVLVQVAKK